MVNFKNFLKKHMVAVISVSVAFVIFLTAIIVLATLPRDIVYYKVSFDANGGSRQEALEVLRGRKITVDFPVPVKKAADGSDMLFLGWYKDDAAFEYDWQKEYDIVTEDVKLYAQWRDPQIYPTEVGIQKKAFASSLTWQQLNVVEGVTEFEVYFDGNPRPTSGDFTVDGTLVKWTPKNFFGDAFVRVVTKQPDNPDIKEVTKKRAVTFRKYVGTGEQSDPFIISAPEEINELINYEGEVGNGEYFEIREDIVSNSGSEKSVFMGNFDGNGHNITITGTSGFFHRIGKTGYVSDFYTLGKVEDAIKTAPTANYNEGTIENVENLINVARVTDSTGLYGEIGNFATKDKGLVGGIVRINEPTGIIKNCRNGNMQTKPSAALESKINASIGGGGIAGENRGTIEDCINYGRLGSRANYETGKTIAYSYMGGIAGFNFGTITRSCNAGSLFAQRDSNSPIANRVFGGIVGYNAGTVSESYHTGERIHADEFVGGIAGVNAGNITDCYVKAVQTADITRVPLMIGGRTNVGGITGKSEGNGTVRNSYFVDSINTFNRSYSSSAADKDKNHTMRILFAANGTAYLIAPTSENCVYTTIEDPLRPVSPVCNTNAPTGTNNQNGNPLLTDFTSILGSKFTDRGLLVWQTR